MTPLEVALRKNRNNEEYRDIPRNVDRAGSTCISSSNACDMARLEAGADQYHPATVDVVEVALACSDIIRRWRGLVASSCG